MDVYAYNNDCNDIDTTREVYKPGFQNIEEGWSILTEKAGKS